MAVAALLQPNYNDALMFSARDLQNYYDTNTRAFLKFGQGGHAGAMHRAVWGQGVRSRTEAFRYLDRRILEVLASQPERAQESPHVIDLGCGVGASLMYLAEHGNARGTGITLSPVQVEIATRQIAARGLSDRVRCIEGDFLALPASVQTADLVISIEAFVHAPNADRYFASAAGRLRPGGRLVIVDDFLSPRAQAGQVTAREARWLAEFRHGWRVSSLMSTERASDLAQSHGLRCIQDDDLTDFLELRRPRDQLITAMVTVGRQLPIKSPRWLNLLGGNGLQLALVSGALGYHFCVWEKLA